MQSERDKHVQETKQQVEQNSMQQPYFEHIHNFNLKHHLTVYRHNQIPWNFLNKDGNHGRIIFLPSEWSISHLCNQYDNRNI